MTEKGSGTVLSVRTGEGSGCGGDPRGTIHRSDETGSDQRASDSAHRSRSGSVSDEIEEVEEPEATEVVTGDLV